MSHRLKRTSAVVSWSAALALAACTSAPLDPIPEPLPESADWVVAAQSAEGGAFLGLKVRENDSGALDELFFEPGVKVVRVVENSPAARAEIAAGDVLLTFAGNEVNDPEALTALLARYIEAEPTTMTLQRGDSVYEVRVALDPQTDESDLSVELTFRKDPARTRAGWRTTPTGVLLVSAGADSPLTVAGVPLGATVTSVDGSPVNSARELIRLLAKYDPGSEVQFSYRTREGADRSTAVTLQDQPTKVTGAALPILFNYTSDADGEETEFALIDLWFISLFRYRREGNEKTYKVLRFISWSTGIGELAE